MSETKVGRPREAQVRHEERECKQHGRTTHSRYASGYSGATTWKCLKCQSEDKKQYYADIKSGEKIVGQAKARETTKTGQVCGICHETKPLTGVCDNCD
jgi:ribosomal protein L37AE/L43A